MRLASSTVSQHYIFYPSSATSSAVPTTDNHVYPHALQIVFASLVTHNDH